MAKANKVEHLTITASDNNSTPGVLAKATSLNIESVIIQNTSDNDCYLTWASDAVPVATNTMYELLAHTDLAQNEGRFNNFATINKTGGANSKIVITANYS